MNKSAYKNYVYLPYRLILFTFYLIASIYQFVFFRNNYKLVKGCDNILPSLSFKTFDVFQIYLKNENEEISIHLKDDILQINKDGVNCELRGQIQVSDNKIIFGNDFKLYKINTGKNFLIEIDNDDLFISTEVKISEIFVFKNFTETIILYKGISDEFGDISHERSSKADIIIVYKLKNDRSNNSFIEDYKIKNLNVLNSH